MAEKFPLDEFDLVVLHGGRHRVHRTLKIRVLEFARVLFIALLIAILGYFGLKLAVNANLFTSTSTPVETVSIQEVAKSLEITVLDATGVTGTADKVAKMLVDAGFNVIAAGKLGGDVASNAEVSQTIVYYSNAADKAAITVIAKASGGYPIRRSTAYAGAVTLVIGTDFK